MANLSQAAKEHQKQLNRDNYHTYKSMGICWVCKTRYSAPGRTRCEICARIANAKRRKSDPGNAKKNAMERERYQRLKASGICVRCGHRKAKTGNVRCGICERKQKESRLAYRVRKRVEEGKV